MKHPKVGDRLKVVRARPDAAPVIQNLIGEVFYVTRIFTTSRLLSFDDDRSVYFDEVEYDCSLAIAVWGATDEV